MSVLPPKPCPKQELIEKYKQVIKNLIDPIECAEIVGIVRHQEDWDRAMRIYAEEKLKELEREEARSSYQGRNV